MPLLRFPQSAVRKPRWAKRQSPAKCLQPAKRLQRLRPTLWVPQSPSRPLIPAQRRLRRGLRRPERPGERNPRQASGALRQRPKPRHQRNQQSRLRSAVLKRPTCPRCSSRLLHCVDLLQRLHLLHLLHPLHLQHLQHPRHLLRCGSREPARKQRQAPLNPRQPKPAACRMRRLHR